MDTTAGTASSMLSLSLSGSGDDAGGDGGGPPRSSFFPDSLAASGHSATGLHLSSHASADVPRVPSVHDTAAIDALKRTLHDSVHTGLCAVGENAASDGDGDGDGEDPHAAAFRRALESAVRDAFGILAADVWFHDECDGSFHHAPGGYFRHPDYRPTGAARRALRRIEDPEDPEYVPGTRQVPGAGLAGYFWSQCGVADRHCTWRSVAAIVDDPDQPPYPRMQQLLAAGYGLAAGVPFDARGHRGVVLYLARGGADLAQLAEATNDVHLRASADLLGAVSAQSITSAASRGAKAARMTRTLRRVRAKLTAILVFHKWFKEGSRLEVDDGGADGDGTDLAKPRAAPPSYAERVAQEMRRKMRKTYRQSVVESCSEALRRKARVTAEKSKGGAMQPPPPMPWKPATWVFVGAFLTLWAVAALGSALEGATGYPIVLGPFGALMTLQYGLTPAPASQPRNILYGQVVALSLALVLNVAIPASALARVPLTTALAIAAMCKLGITHPPAGAAAAIFASSDVFDPFHALAMLLGNVLAITFAVLINNLNDKRQYPIYYSFVPDGLQERATNILEGSVPCLKQKREARMEQERNELDMSLRLTITEYHRQRNLRKTSV